MDALYIKTSATLISHHSNPAWKTAFVCPCVETGPARSHWTPPFPDKETKE